LWRSLADAVTPEPRSPCRPGNVALRRFRAAMVEPGNSITAKEAERRVLENPGFRGSSR
jgi:gentisate 1,2-dioxygenase